MASRDRGCVEVASSALFSEGFDGFDWIKLDKASKSIVTRPSGLRASRTSRYGGRGPPRRSVRPLRARDLAARSAFDWIKLDKAGKNRSRRAALCRLCPTTLRKRRQRRDRT